MKINMSENAFIKLDDTKAGMVCLNKEEINKKIIEASLGSLYYDTQLKKSNNLKKRISNQEKILESSDASQFKAALSKVEKIYKELLSKQDLNHTYVHIDLDAFFAAVEMRDKPSLTSKPIAVGSLQMISTSNYIARRYGVRAAMAGFIGKKLCPSLELIPHRFYKYKEASDIFHSIIALYDPKFYSGGLDEAYLDLTEFMLNQRFFSTEKERTFTFSRICECFCHNTNSISDFSDRDKACCCQFKSLGIDKLEFEVPGCQLAHQKFKVNSSSDTITITFGTSVEDTVREIRLRIYEAIGVTCSAGIAPTSLLCKICTDVNKPSGQFVVSSERSEIYGFLHELAINKINGIGKVTTALLNAIGIQSCGDIWQQRAKLGILYSDTFLRFLLNVYIGGRIHSPEPGTPQHDDGDYEDELKSRKSIGHERTVSRCDARYDESHIYNICSELCKRVSQDMIEKSIAGNVVAVKMKSSNFRVITRMQKLYQPTNDYKTILKSAWNLIKPELEMAKKAADLECKRLKELKSQYSNTERYFHELSHDLVNLKKPDISETNHDILKMMKTSDPLPVQPLEDVRDNSTLIKEMKIDATESEVSCNRDYLQDDSSCNSNSNISPHLFNRENNQSKEILEDPQDFLYLRLLGVRMVKLINNEAHEKQTKYLLDWMTPRTLTNLVHDNNSIEGDNVKALTACEEDEEGDDASIYSIQSFDSYHQDDVIDPCTSPENTNLAIFGPDEVRKPNNGSEYLCPICQQFSVPLNYDYLEKPGIPLKMCQNAPQNDFLRYARAIEEHIDQCLLNNTRDSTSASFKFENKSFTPSKKFLSLI